MLKKLPGCLLLFLCLPLCPEKSAVLQDIISPISLVADRDRCYIVEKPGAAISIYNLNTMKLIRKFGKMGEGPGEINATPFGAPVMVSPGSNSLLINSHMKISYFTRDGDYLREIKSPPFSVFREFNNVFVATSSTIHQNQFLLTINLHDQDLRKIKELFVSDISIGPNSTYLFPKSPLEYAVYKSAVYIVTGGDAFIIDVFNESGNKIRTIKKEYPRQPVTADFKAAAADELRIDPFYKMYWDRIKNDLKFKDFFPAISRMDINNDKIYCVTHKKQDHKTECIVMDLNGAELKRIFLPVPQISVLQPYQLFAFENNRYYYLVENEKSENWELHVEKL